MLTEETPAGGLATLGLRRPKHVAAQRLLAAPLRLPATAVGHRVASRSHRGGKYPSHQQWKFHPGTLLYRLRPEVSDSDSERCVRLGNSYFGTASFANPAGQFACPSRQLLKGVKGIHFQSEAESMEPADCEDGCGGAQGFIGVSHVFLMCCINLYQISMRSYIFRGHDPCMSTILNTHKIS